MHVTKLFGDSNITFKSCVEEKMTCKNDLSGPNAVGINPKSIKNIGRKVSYQFPVVNKPPVDANKRQQGEIIIHVSKSEKTPFCLVALEYLIENRLSFLRDNRLIEAISRPN